MLRVDTTDAVRVNTTGYYYMDGYCTPSEEGHYTAWGMCSAGDSHCEQSLYIVSLELCIWQCKNEPGCIAIGWSGADTICKTYQENGCSEVTAVPPPGWAFFGAPGMTASGKDSGAALYLAPSSWVCLAPSSW
ncbi:hypothetical protein CYMTET_15563, partial [Cymbomonas tetramitiformis]